MRAFKSAAAVALALFLYAPLAAAAGSGPQANRVHPIPSRTGQVPARSSVGTRASTKAPAIRRTPRHRVDDLELPQLGWSRGWIEDRRNRERLLLL